MFHNSRVMIAIPMDNDKRKITVHLFLDTGQAKWIHYGPFTVRGASQVVSETDEAVDIAGAFKSRPSRGFWRCATRGEV